MTAPSENNSQVISVQPNPCQEPPPPYPVQNNKKKLGKTQNIHDWYCWSLFSLIFTFSIPGVLAMASSLACHSMKKQKNYHNAKLMSQLACLFNVTALFYLFVLLVLIYFQ